MSDLLCEAGYLAGLVDALGSPLNIVLPQQITENLRQFEDTIGRRRIDGRVYYAHKANRSSALVRELAAAGAWIDVASLAELQHALSSGFRPGRIMATGPKNDEFLWLSVLAGITVNADSAAELETVAAMAGARGCGPVDVLVRLSSFTSSGAKILTRPSRFGISDGELDVVLDMCEHHRDTLVLRGFSYHLDTIGIAEKARAFDRCLLASEQACDRGFPADVVDIGGGYGVDYLADGTEWEEFTSALAQAVLGRREPVTWQNVGYGLRNENGRLRGSLNLYPAFRPVSGTRYLGDLLAAAAPSFGAELADVVLEGMYRLWVEPGRSLLNQCGLVLARVLDVGVRGGDTFVRLDLNAADVSLEEHGVHLDPVLVPGDRAAPGSPPGAAFLIGNLCLESDFISRRRIWFDTLPRAGDLLAFPNTAGYFMDFTANHALAQPVARTAAVVRTDGGWSWTLDAQYWPIPDGVSAGATAQRMLERIS